MVWGLPVSAWRVACGLQFTGAGIAIIVCVGRISGAWLTARVTGLPVRALWKSVIRLRLGRMVRVGSLRLLGVLCVLDSWLTYVIGRFVLGGMGAIAVWIYIRYRDVQNM